MRPVVLRIIYHVRFGVRDEAETAGSLRFGVLHNDDIHNFTPFLKMGLQRFVRSTVIQSSDKDFAMNLGLVLKIGRYVQQNGGQLGNYKRKVE
jgi:hypothetical protein